MEQIPKIINKSKTKYNKIFNIEVLESNGYESKKKILKEIQIKDDSTVIKLNNIFSEAMINRFSNENLNNSEHMYINNNMHVYVYVYTKYLHTCICIYLYIK